ncbi:SIS domain-containing protein [Streptomyces hoynatensis]|uniref:SIS domain-containing protein n=1 Tax=Streptomyces hoynatensis TaxID=1141874 RepID=A0A3A9YV80_9ACTN|nr:SIS domain-containing protein [Streptomyces hoynatensis]RKN39484.1 SIS domain-containing protein [Streptomyces hoynatensis]
MTETESTPRTTETLLERITRAMPTLRRSERKVGEAVLLDPARAMQLTMAEYAQVAGVSEPTVMRFCSSVGCRSFQDFRIQLAQTVALGLPVTHSAIAADDDSADLAGKIFDHTITSLDRARRNLDPEAVERAIQALFEAESILFAGLGASGIIAQDAQQKFPLFGVPCDAPADFHQQFIAASMSRPGAVTFAVSNTGHTAETLTVARAARKNGAKVIALVGNEGPLSELADITLKAVTFEDTDVYTPSTSRLAGLVVIDILATGVALRRSSEHRERVRRMKSQLAVMRHEAGGDIRSPGGQP